MKKAKVAALFAAMALALATGGGYAAPKSDNSEVVTVFDPATYKGSVGEVVEINGEKYLKIVTEDPDWKQRIYIDPVSLKGKKTFSATLFGEKSEHGLIISVQLRDVSDPDTWKFISFVGTYDIDAIPTTPTVCRAGVANPKDNIVSKSMLCTEFGVLVEDPADNWKKHFGVTVYIGKITAF